MPARILDGKALSERIIGDLAPRIGALVQEGRRPHLCAVRVGNPPASDVFVQSQRRVCEDVGIEFTLEELPEDSAQGDVEALLNDLGGRREISGVMLHLPLPDGVDVRKAQSRIPPAKDVEGVNPQNLGWVVVGEPRLSPCTGAAAYELVKETGVEVEGAELVVVGHSEIAGKPVGLLLLDRLATTTFCHIATRDLASHTRRAEILVVAVGKAGLITGDMVKPGAVVVDVGINRVKDSAGKTRVVGDVLFDEVAEVASYITPVPGGVGPVTVAILLRNLVEAVEQ